MTKYEVKRFVESFINKFKGSISLIDKNQDVYTINLPEILKADIRKLDRGMVLIGTYYPSKYEYIALGNKTVMCMLNKVARPVCSVIGHPSLHGVLFVLKIEARDGKNKPKKAQIVSMISGQGIDSITLPRLFTKFASKSVKGTGLGLFISKGIIEAGGKIWGENNPDGRGAKFSFSLPTR